MRIFALNAEGTPLGGGVEHTYDAGGAERDRTFGGDTPIALPSAETCAFSAVVPQVTFADGTTWKMGNRPWEPIPAAVPLDTAWNNEALAGQFRAQYGEDYRYLPKAWKDLWRCTCGALNRQEEDVCHVCQKGRELPEFDAAALVQAQPNPSEPAAAQPKKKRKKWPVIAAACVLAAGLAGGGAFYFSGVTTVPVERKTVSSDGSSQTTVCTYEGDQIKLVTTYVDTQNKTKAGSSSKSSST